MATLQLIDLSGIFWACWHASANEELSAAYDRTMSGVRRLIETEKADHVAVACDFPPYKRKALLPQYKANREAAPPLAVEQLRKVEQRLRDDGLTVWSVPGYEADDVIATAAHIAVARDMRVAIASGDKDLLQCVGPGVAAVSPATLNRYDESGVLDRMGVPPLLVGDLLALTGDKSDNIPGVHGVGAKTAAAWLTNYGSLEGVISHASELGRFTQVVEEKAEDIRLWRRVVQLDLGVPLEFEELFAEKEVKPLVKNDMPEDDDAEAFDAVTGDLGPEKVVIGADAKITPATAGHIGELTLDMPRSQQQIVRAAQERVITLQPRNAKEAWWLAGTLLNSRLYPKFKSQEQVYAIIVRGQELGIGAMASLDCIHMIEGKPTMGAHLIIARAIAHPKCEWFRLVESTDERATYETKHRDYVDPTRLSYTLAEAKAAGLCPQNPRTSPVLQKNEWGKEKDVRGQWEKRPKELVRKTAGVQLTRVVYPDAALGLYATEELSDE